MRISLLDLGGGVAQSVRALACHARGRGFEPRHSRHHSVIRHVVSPASNGAEPIEKITQPTYTKGGFIIYI